MVLAARHRVSACRCVPGYEWVGTNGNGTACGNSLTNEIAWGGVCWLYGLLAERPRAEQRMLFPRPPLCPCTYPTPPPPISAVHRANIHWFKSSWRCAWAKIALIAFSGATPSSNIARHPASRISPEHDRGRPPPPRGDAAATTAAATDVESPPPKMLLESSPRRVGCVMSHSSASTCEF